MKTISIFHNEVYAAVVNKAQESKNKKQGIIATNFNHPICMKHIVSICQSYVINLVLKSMNKNCSYNIITFSDLKDYSNLC